MRAARGRAAVRAALTALFACASACVSLDGLTGGVAPDAGPPDAGATVDAETGTGATTDDGGAPPDRALAYRNAILSDRPIAYWRFEETSGTTVADETAAYPGLYVQSPTLGRPGIFEGEGAVELPVASNAHVEIDAAALGFAGVVPYSVEIWVKPAVFRDFIWIAGTETYPPRSGWSLLTDATGEVFYEVWDPEDGGAAEVRSISTNKALALGRFQHVVVTFNGQFMKTYLDGVLATTGSSTKSAPPSSVLRLGCRRSNTGTLVNCADGWALDEAALYDYPLTDEQVAAHHALAGP